MYGKKSGVVTYSPLMGIKRIDQLIRQYGLQSRAVDVTSFEIDLAVLAKSFSDPSKVIDLFLAATEEAVARGAEVIIPGCGVLNMIMVQNRVSTVKDTGVPILDISGALMKNAEMMVILKEKSGVGISRKGYYKGPSREKYLLTRELYR
jgi:Asp/Glu/hydantoin racemase